jgi:hypothetical protein
VGPKAIVNIVGVVAVTAYAALQLLVALVLDPLEQVPGHSIAWIYARLAADPSNMDNVSFDIVSASVVAAIGIALAVAAAIVGGVTRLPAHLVAVIFLGILGLGGPMTFLNGFGLGMDIADSLGVGGSASPAAFVLYGVSALAIAAIVPVVLIGAATAQPRWAKALS